jgi:hypothetical protein
MAVGGDGMSRAERQAVIALLSDVDPSTITLEEVIDGVAIITATTSDGKKTLAMMPALKPRTPGRITRIWHDRVESNLTGRCPRCHAVAGTTVDECADLAHDDGCPVADSRMLTAHVDTQGLRSVARMAAGDA